MAPENARLGLRPPWQPTSASVLLVGRHDAGREPGGTPALDELDHRVQVHRAIGRDRGGELRLDARSQEALLTPRDEIVAGLRGRRAGAVCRER
jgi:hypothetical protein